MFPLLPIRQEREGCLRPQVDGSRFWVLVPSGGDLEELIGWHMEELLSGVPSSASF